MTTTNSASASSFIYTSDLPKEDIEHLLLRAAELKAGFRQKKSFAKSLKRRQVALFFAEPSTRTRISFQMAVQRMAGQCLHIDGGITSSMSKGETFADTFWTIHDNRPDAIVVRCGPDGQLDKLAERSEIPIINAGFGTFAHPTQALLDIMTLIEQGGSIERQKVLFVGDVKHSRVAASNFHLLGLLGAEIGICGPEQWLPSSTTHGFKVFTELAEAMTWATVYYGLRVQFERHSSDQLLSREEFISNFSLNGERLSALPATTLIMHPGPVNWGVEFQPDVADDPRLLISQQVENGVYVRAALLEKLIARRNI